MGCVHLTPLDVRGLIPSLVAINRNNLIKLLISIFILNLLPIVFFSFLLVPISLLFQFSSSLFLVICIIPIHVKNFQDSFLTL